MLDRHLTIRSLAILACASVAHAQSERAYAALTELSTVNQRGFYVYKDLDSGACYKFGELPEYGPPTPARLIKLIGPDRELFLKGTRCENQGRMRRRNSRSGRRSCL